MRSVLKISARLAGLVVISMIMLVVTAYVYEDEIVVKVKEAIDQQMDTRIVVEEVEFSLLERFPNASFKFSSPWIEDKLIRDDTLLLAKELFLEFNILQLLSKDYVIERALIREGVVNMHTDSEGHRNYIFWKESEGVEGEKMEFDIRDLDIEDIRFRFEDRQSNVLITSWVEEMQLEMQVDSDSDVQLKVESECAHFCLWSDGTEYVDSLALELSGPMSIESDATVISLDGLTVELEEVPVEVKGEMNEVREGWHLGLSAIGTHDLEQLVDVLPDRQRDVMNDYSAKGQVDLAISVEGLTGGDHSPQFIIDFASKHADIEEKRTGFELEDISVAGSYRTLEGSSERLTFDRFHAQLGKSILSMKGSIENFDSPWVNAGIGYSGHADELTGFFHLDSIFTARGSVDIKADIRGPFPRSEGDLARIKKLKVEGYCDLNGIDVTFAHDQQLEGLVGKIELDNEDLKVDSMKGRINGSEFVMIGAVRQFIPYLVSDDRGLDISARFESPVLRLDEWFKESTESTSATFTLNEDIDFDLDLKVDRLEYQDFVAEEINGTCRMVSGRFKADPISFRSSEGHVEGEVEIMKDDRDSFKAECRLEVNDIDIRQVFQEFHDFGQEFLTADHIKGKASAEVDYKCRFDEGLNVDMPSVTMLADLRIEDGELLQHESMVEIIRALKERNLLRSFVRVNELEQEMKHLKFEELSNRVIISNEVISIPEMLISSNAMDLNISGEHGFNDIVDYKFNFRLREILVNKQNPEFLIEDDGLGHRIYLQMKGHVSDPDIEMDKGSAKKSRQEAIAEAKEDIKEFFRNPFAKKEQVEYKKDTSVITIVEFEEEEVAIKDPDEKEGTKKTSNKKDEGKVEVIFELEDDEENDDDEDF